MNKVRASSKGREKIIKVILALIELHKDLENLNDDELQRKKQMNYEDPLRFLDLNKQNIFKNCSNQSPLREKITKRNNLIIGNTYICKKCDQQFPKHYSLGGHCQKCHSSKKQQQDFNKYEQFLQKQYQ